MRASLPLVSVVIPTYNYCQYIEEALDSIAAQTYPSDRIEVVVVDDGSTDGTSAVVQAYEGLSLTYVEQQNQGKAAATALGIKRSQGKYIFNLDADDLFLPTKIAASVKIYENNPTIVHVASPALVTEADGQTEKYVESLPVFLQSRILAGKDVLHYFYQKNQILGGGSTFSGRADVLKHMPLNSNIDMYTDEYLIFYTLLHGCTFFLEEPQSIWRVHGRNYSRSKEKTMEKDERLLRSSNATLGALSSLADVPEELLTLYTFKHDIRKITYLEKHGGKDLGVIFDFFFRWFLGEVPYPVLKRYKALNRLVPSAVLDKAKKWRRRF